MALPRINLPHIDTGPFQYGHKKEAHDLKRNAGRYQHWLRTHFPEYFSVPLADYHHPLWQWDFKSPLLLILPRGGGKSTNAEAFSIYSHVIGRKGYVWYVSATQSQADDHVSNIASMLAEAGAERKVNKYGSSRGWRRNRVWTEDDFIVDALGLDVARRGVKLEERRPDLIIFDDVDSETDTVETVDKKSLVITRKIIPAGAPTVSILFVQNLVIPHGIVSRILHKKVDWLTNATVVGPIPAVEGMKTEKQDGRDVIVVGTPTWPEGMDIASCQKVIDDAGLSAFKHECQHEVFNTEAQIFLPQWWDGKNRHDGKLNTIARYMFVDTAFKDKQTNDPSAIAVVDLTADYRIALRTIWEGRVQSAELPRLIERMAREWGGEREMNAVVVEDKGSGTTTIQTIRKSSPDWLASIVTEFLPQGSKEYRARNASVWCGRDCVLLPEDASEHFSPSFADPQLGQLFRFPNADHDDMTDTFTMAILFLENYLKRGFRIRAGYESKPRTAPAVHDRVKRALKGK